MTEEDVLGGGVGEDDDEVSPSSCFAQGGTRQKSRGVESSSSSFDCAVEGQY